ncbi:hypothetical protein K1719_042250 [Acacia pycnantha]|nr:hypothetical protein K1719_042250 [Acacia pycnantha]
MASSGAYLATFTNMREDQIQKGLNDINVKNKGIALKTIKEVKSDDDEEDEDEDGELGMMVRRFKKFYKKDQSHESSSMKMRRRGTKCQSLRLVAQEESDNEEWMLKTYVGDQSKFASIKNKEGGKVTFGGNESGRIHGIGKIGNSNGPQIKDVYLVDGLCHNLLSVSQSTDKGNLVIFDSEECLIVSKDALSLDSIKSKALFELQRSWTFRVKSLGGNLYTLVIVDDFSRFTWVILLSSKDKTFDQFIVFAKKVQNEKGFSIAGIRTDHGGEFENHAFGEFVIVWELIITSRPRTPQKQNGVVERKNRVLLEMARSMLNEKQTSQVFWVML